MLEEKKESTGLNVGDIYYVLFRHKWKIILISLAALAVAAALFINTPPMYQTEARLFLRYMVENQGVSPADNTSQVTTIDRRGENILNSELEILTSLDLARLVVGTVGAERILANAGGGDSPARAAALIRKNLRLEVPRRSNIIRILLQHPDPEIVQEILASLVDHYQKKHMEIHREVGVHDNFLAQQTDRFRIQLRRTEDELRRLKADSGVISTEEANRTYGSLMSATKQELYRTEAELESRRIILAEVQKAFASASDNEEAPPAAPPSKVLQDYQNLTTALAFLRRREMELEMQYTATNPRVRSIRERIKEEEARKHDLEQQYPNLALRSRSNPADNQHNPLMTEASHIMALEAKMKVLSSQLDRIRDEAAGLGVTQAQLAELESRKAVEEANFRHYAASLEKARIDEAMGTAPNIIRVQEPSDPVSVALELRKQLALIVGGGLAAALGLAFLMEMFVDQRLRRPGEITRSLGLPLFLAIPRVRRLKRFRRHELALANGGSAEAQSGPLSPYHEALRDRLIHYFESQNMTHKPKLVGITSASPKAGVSTIATGLAAALSECGDGNVLLVDMHPYPGKSKSGNGDFGLDELIESANKSDALVRDNLYLAKGIGTNGSLPRVLPKRFNQLMPRLKASDYDYIIFDLPPISQTSIASRVAGFMDMTLLVIESERTNRDTAKRAAGILQDSRATVASVLNKCRAYIPQRLHQEI
jgi:polysaccharide biosynthesis transport protein